MYRNNLGQILERLERGDEAAQAYDAALALDPGNAEACNNLGHLLQRRDRLAEAETLFRRAIDLDARYAEPHANLANLLKDRGDLDEALASYRRAIELRPDLSLLHSNLLLALHYHSGLFAGRSRARAPAMGGAARGAARRRRAGRTATTATRSAACASVMFRPICASTPSRDSCCRLSSGTIVRKSKCSRIPTRRVPTPSRTSFDPESIDGATCTRCRTSSSRLPCATTASTFSSISAVHSAHNRLLVFARKPAPVQVTYLAYCSTTGVDAIDYRLTDGFLDPPGSDDAHYTERSVRLPGCYWCYSAPPLPWRLRCSESRGRRRSAA